MSYLRTGLDDERGRGPVPRTRADVTEELPGQLTLFDSWPEQHALLTWSSNQPIGTYTVVQYTSWRTREDNNEEAGQDRKTGDD